MNGTYPPTTPGCLGGCQLLARIVVLEKAVLAVSASAPAATMWTNLVSNAMSSSVLFYQTDLSALLCAARPSLRSTMRSTRHSCLILFITHLIRFEYALGHTRRDRRCVRESRMWLAPSSANWLSASRHDCAPGSKTGRRTASVCRIAHRQTIACPR